VKAATASCPIRNGQVAVQKSLRNAQPMTAPATSPALATTNAYPVAIEIEVEFSPYALPAMFQRKRMNSRAIPMASVASRPTPEDQ
jgi:hypothetical protein